MVFKPLCLHLKRISKSHNSKCTQFISLSAFGLCDRTHSMPPLCRISQHLQASVHTHTSGSCCGTFALVPSQRLAGVLAALCDHKPWPHHPRDPAGDCQGCLSTSLFVRVRFLLPLAAAPARESASLQRCRWCGLWTSAVELGLTPPTVCMFAFTCSALVLLLCVVSCSQRTPLPQPAPPVRELPAFTFFFFLINFPNVGDQQFLEV